MDNGNFPGNTLNYGYGALWDNALVAGPPPQLDYYGLLYQAQGGNTYNIWANSSPLGGGYSEARNGDWHTAPVTLTVTAIPEPTTCIASALLLLPFGAGTLRCLHRKV